MSSTGIDPFSAEPIAIKAWVKERVVYVALRDERVVSFPDHKFTRLKAASDENLGKVRIRAQGTALRWEEIDEDISVSGVVKGIFE